jgi:hypothetical protein
MIESLDRWDCKEKGVWEKGKNEGEFHAWLLFRFLLMTLLYRRPLQFLRQNFEQHFPAGSADIAHARRDEA